MAIRSFIPTITIGLLTILSGAFTAIESQPGVLWVYCNREIDSIRMISLHYFVKYQDGAFTTPIKEDLA